MCDSWFIVLSVRLKILRCTASSDKLNPQHCLAWSFLFLVNNRPQNSFYVRFCTWSQNISWYYLTYPLFTAFIFLLIFWLRKRIGLSDGKGLTVKGNDTGDKLSKFCFSHIISDYSVGLREEITTKDKEHIFSFIVQLNCTIESSVAKCLRSFLKPLHNTCTYI